MQQELVFEAAPPGLKQVDWKNGTEGSKERIVPLL